MLNVGCDRRGCAGHKHTRSLLERQMGVEAESRLRSLRPLCIHRVSIGVQAVVLASSMKVYKASCKFN